MGAQTTAKGAIVAVLAAALLCAGCSGGDSSTGPTSPATSGSSSTQSPDEPIVTGDADTPITPDSATPSADETPTSAVSTTDEPTEAPEPSTVTVSYPDHIVATYAQVACNATLGQPGVFSVQAQSADSVTDNLVVIIKDGRYSQLTFSHAGKGWVLPFDASGEEPPAATIVDGTTLQIVGLHGKAADVDKPSSTHDVDVSGALTCTTGRLDDQQVSGGDTSDNILQLSGGLNESVTLSEVLCTPKDGGLIAVGQAETGDSDMITVTMTPSSTGMQVSFSDGAWQAVDTDGTLAQALTRSGSTITILDAKLMPASSDTSGDLTISGAMRCTAGSSE
jgi:hypothetical protein